MISIRQIGQYLLPVFILRGKINRKLNEVALNDDATLIHHLLKKGADIEVQDHGNKELIFASANGHVEVVKELLKKDGIDVNAQDNYGCPALIWASANGHVEVVKELLKKDGIDVNAQNNYGDTALIWAAQNGHLEVVKELLKKDGIDVNAQNNYGDTALILAIKNAHSEVVKELLRKLNPNKEIKDSDVEKETSSHLIRLLNKPLSEAMVFAKRIENIMDNAPSKRNYYPFEAELLLFLRHPELIDRDPTKTHDFTKSITSINRFHSEIQDVVVKAWADIGHLTFSFPYWIYDTKYREESLFTKYGFKPISGREKGTDKTYGNGYLISNDKTLLEFRRGYLLATNPDFGTVVIRNSSFVFGRDLLKHVAYYSPNYLSEKDLEKYDPNLDKSLINVIVPAINHWEVGEKLGALVDGILRVKEDYRRWKFDSGGRKGNDFTGHLSPGFTHIINFIRYLNFDGQSLPDLGFVNPLYPIIQPYRFRECSTSNEVDRYKITEDRIKELADFVEGNWSESKYPDSDFIEFLKCGVQNQGELVMLKQEEGDRK